MKPDLIFIHGMWSRHTVWSDWVRVFQAQGYNCLTPDLPGHSEHDSDTQLAGTKLQQYVDAVVDLAKGCDRPVLIGHSLGGLLAQLAAQHVELSGLVLVNSAAPGQVFPLRAVMLPGLVRHFAKWGLWKRSFRLSDWEADYLVFNRVPYEQRALFRQLLIAESGRVAYAVGYGRLNLAGTNQVDRSKVNCPILCLAGGSDRIIPPSVSRRVAKWYGGSLDYREFSGQGHWLLGEPGWQAHVESIGKWLAALGAEQA